MLILGGLISVAYASSTIITDTGITTTNLTILGTCSGCGASEGSFNSWNTMALNGSTSAVDLTLCFVKVGNDGAVLTEGNNRAALIYVNGTEKFNHASNGCASGNNIDQSMLGTYKVLLNSDAAGKVSVYKSGQFKQLLGINLSQFSGSSITTGSIAISPDGHYIAVAAENSGASGDKVLVFQGS